MIDNNFSIKVFESIKEKNIIHYLDNSNYYYIFYYLLIANYLINVMLFIVSWILFFNVNNKKKYLTKIYPYKLLLFFNTWYIYFLYIFFKFNIFLVVSLVFLFINSSYGYSFMIEHNNTLTHINSNNTKYRSDYNNDYEDNREHLRVINANDLIETIEEHIEINSRLLNENGET